PIGFPELPAGHLDHFYIVGLETAIDCGDAGHVRGIDRSFPGEGFGASQRDEHRHCETGLQRHVDSIVIAHAAASSDSWISTAPSSRRNMRTIARPRSVSPFIGRDLAVVDPLLVHPFPA